jgi:hypothetical protein
MPITCADYKTADMQVLLHHVYEYKKGLRSLVLHTMGSEEQDKAEEILQRKGIKYFLQAVNERKINIFFGSEQCVNIVESFGKESLSDFTDEQDFILGIMLGYDRNQQCDRYIKRKGVGHNFLLMEELVNSN